MIIFNMSGFEIINIVVSNVFKVLYFIVLICAILSFYKSDNKNKQLLLFIFLPIFLLFTGIRFKVITMIIVFPLFFFRGIKEVRRVIGILLYLTFITFGVLGLLIGNLGGNKVIDQQYSPDKMYKAVTIDSDQGALGGDTYVKLEGIYFEIFKRNIKTLYHGHWGEKPKVIWVNNDIININGRDMNIYTSEKWENKK